MTNVQKKAGISENRYIREQVKQNMKGEAEVELDIKQLVDVQQIGAG